MSRASFPRPEHAALLGEKIAAYLRSGNLPLEVASKGPDHYRCSYRYGFRKPPEAAWRELSIHFQVAERLETSNDAGELNGILDLFLERNFPPAPAGNL